MKKKAHRLLVFARKKIFSSSFNLLPALLMAITTFGMNASALQQPQRSIQNSPTGGVAPLPQQQENQSAPLDIPGESPTQPAGQIKIGPVGEAATGNGIDYHGGPVMLTAHNVYFIWYGNWSGNSALTLLPQFMQNLSNTPYFSINTTYENGSNQNVGSSVGMSTQVFDNYSHGANLNNTGVRDIVATAISRGVLPVDGNGIYFVLTSKDVTEPTFCSSFCGYHNHSSMFNTDIKYAFVGDPTQQCISGCANLGETTLSPNANPGADSMISTMAHELSETVTDPDLNAWFQTGSGNENGDLCRFDFQPSFTAPNGAQANLTLAGVNYLVQKNWINDGGGRCTMASTGNVFFYASAHDQYYGCHGIASGSVSDCNNIVDANDRLICQAVAQHSQTPCSTPVTDRNLQLSCFGIAFAPNFPSNCRDITNPEMQSFCYGISSGGTVSTPNCSTMSDAGARALCNAMALHDSSFCSSISNANDRQFCLGVSVRAPSQCSTISSCPDPNAQAACLNGGGSWDWNSCSCTFPVNCDPAQQQACINSGGIWDSSNCSCSSCGQQIFCAQSPGAPPRAAQFKSQDVIHGASLTNTGER